MAVLKTHWPAPTEQPKKVLVEDKKAEIEEKEEFVASLPKKPKEKRKYKIVE